MNSTRNSAIPLFYAEAEMAAFPLASEAAFKIGLAELNLSSQSGQELWKETEKYFTQTFHSFSLSTIEAFRNRIWFNNSFSSQSLIPFAHYLRNLAEFYLEPWGNYVVPRNNTAVGGEKKGLEASQSRLRWRWITFAFPPDLLILPFQSGNQNSIFTLSQHLDRHLKDKGFAQIHLHVGAALRFADLWIVTLRTLGDPKIKPDLLKDQGAAFSDGKDFVPWLLRAAAARYLLALYLENSPPRIGFQTYLDNTFFPFILKRFGILNRKLLKKTINELYSGKSNTSLSNDFYELQVLYRAMTRVTSRSLPKELEDLPDCDSLAKFFPRRERITPEMRFLNRSFSYMENYRDPLFSILFWQVVRLRSLLYRHLTLRPMTPGLTWFIRHFRRISQIRKPINNHGILIQSALTIDGFSQGLRSLEIRTSPDDESNVFLWYKKIHERQKKAKDVEIGIVFHLQKERNQKLSGKPRCDNPADPRHNPSGFRYGWFYNKEYNRALALTAVLKHKPQSLRVIRGIDICGDETAVPTWVMVPLIRMIQAAGKEASKKLGNVPPLCTTIHAGEDFLHLFDGLRRVDEAIRYMRLKNGDRIGHGSALGIDPERWASNIGAVIVTKEQRLFDLTWEWDMYANNEAKVLTPNRITFLEKEIKKLSKEIFGEFFDPYYVATLLKSLYEERNLRYVGFPSAYRDSHYLELLKKKSDQLYWLRKYLTSSTIFRHGMETIEVDPLSEVEVLRALQDALKNKIGKMGLVIEINPTSNLLIADLGDMEHHPFWRLFPPRQKEGAIPPVNVAIGSDNPLTLATTIREEYQFALDTLLLAGYSETEAIHWLEQVRETALNSRFTLPYADK